MERVINGKTVTVTPRYIEAQVLTLTAGEAAALNQQMFENVRNNIAAGLKEKDEKGEAYDLQAEYDNYFNQYVFGVRATNGTGTPRRDPIEAEAFAQIKAAIKAELKKRNLKATTEAINEKADQVFTDNKDHWLKKARKAIEDRAKSLGDLDLGDMQAPADVPAAAA